MGYSVSILYHFGFGDDDRFGRYVVVVAVAFGGDAFDGIDHVKTIDHFAEYGVAPSWTTVLPYSSLERKFRKALSAVLMKNCALAE